MSASDKYKSGSKIFTKTGETVPFEMPTLLFGIDLTDLFRQTVERFDALRRGETAPDFDADATNEKLKRRP